MNVVPLCVLVVSLGTLLAVLPATDLGAGETVFFAVALPLMAVMLFIVSRNLHIDRRRPK